MRIDVIPKTRVILAILDPITFPKVISSKDCKVDCILINNSGAEVAKETTVKPITNSEILNLNDNPTELLTSNSPP